MKIPVMENLGAAEDQFDVIDLSDNSIGCIENIPKFPRLHTLLLNNNLVSKITKGLGANVPHCACLVYILESMGIKFYVAFTPTDEQSYFKFL